ncbi:hypothetical protein HAX54_040944 [Datura stramonium]|uniref:Uncharacterized protein n=1 Tax=Datura stramonium TaxID=4076 RepID=A0ABS8VNV1_DATST|nr:hypothetical protein [Datura stramonium]
MKFTLGLSDSLIPEASEDAPVLHLPARLVSSPVRGVLKLAQLAHDDNAQLVKISKAIPLIIQHAIKATMKPVIEKLRRLCAQVDVLEVDEMYEKEQSRGEVTHMRDDIHPVSLWGVPPKYSLYDSRILPNRWVVIGLHSPLELPPEPLMPSVVDISSGHSLI